MAWPLAVSQRWLWLLLAASAPALPQPERLQVRSLVLLEQPVIAGELQLQASAGALLATLLDTATVPRWAARVSRVEVLAFTPPTDYLVRSWLSFPPPLAERELISRSQHGWYQGDLYLQVMAAGEGIAADPTRPRITNAAFCWQARPLADGRLRLRYYSQAELAPWLPRWLTTPLAEAAVAQTLAALPQAVAAHRHRAISDIPPLQQPLTPLCQLLANQP